MQLTPQHVLRLEPSPEGPLHLVMVTWQQWLESKKHSFQKAMKELGPMLSHRLPHLLSQHILVKTVHAPVSLHAVA